MSGTYKCPSCKSTRISHKDGVVVCSKCGWTDNFDRKQLPDYEALCAATQRIRELEAINSDLLAACHAIKDDADMFFPTVCAEHITRMEEAITKAKGK